MVHGFATLWRSGNLTALLEPDPLAASDEVARGLVVIAKVTDRQLQQGQRAPKHKRSQPSEPGDQPRQDAELAPPA